MRSDRQAHSRIAIVADTHMPRRARELPRRCVDELRRADVIVHAGDFTDASVLEQIASFGVELVAVHGNVDSPQLTRRLPAETSFEVGQVRIAVVHDGGPRTGRLRRLRRRFPQADAVVFGHSHMPLHESGDGGFQIFNPGSPTDRRRAPLATMGIANVRGGAVRFEHVVVEPDG